MKSIFIAMGMVFLLTNANQSLAQQSKTKVKTSFHVDGVCEMCKARIETAALKVKGVRMAIWDVDTKTISVVYSTKKTTEDNIHQAIAGVGHNTSKVSATAEAYNALHECCKYNPNP